MRREFLKAALAGSAALFLRPRTLLAAPPADLPEGKIAPPALPKGVPILQGATSTTDAQFSVLVPKDFGLRVRVFEKTTGAAAGGEPSYINVKQPYSSWMASRVSVRDLSPGVEYVLEVLADSTGESLDRREFATLSDVKPERVRVVLASCMRDGLHDVQKAMWDAVRNEKPHFLFLLGDNVYVDDGFGSRISEERIWRRYVETRLAVDLYWLPRLIPTLATWDDHDYGKNNKVGRAWFRAISQGVFRAMYAQAGSGSNVDSGPGIATLYSAYGQRFFLMDNRSFRSSVWIPFVTESHWGRGQTEWMLKHLRDSEQPAWLFSGSQYFGAYRWGHSFEGNQPFCFGELLRDLSKAPAPVIFGSGDVHYSELMRIEPDHLGYETYELTSSSLHSSQVKPAKGNPRRIASTGAYNFVMADVRCGEGPCVEMDVECIGAGGVRYFHQRNLAIRK